MNIQPIKLFSASAGSGKTYTLTLEYIKLALATEDSKGYFRKILAVTFTNKAAEEMKDRIIKTLHSIAKNQLLELSDLKEFQKSNEYINYILTDYKKENIAISRQELILRAENTLNQILQDYGLFSVLTIDSFVQKLSQSFIEELNLPDQFEVNLDQKQLLNDVINEVLDQINTQADPTFKEAILNYSIEEVEEDKSWNSLRENLINFLSVLFKEDYLEREKEISTFKMEDFKQIENNIIQFHSNALKELTQIAKSVNELVDNHQLSVADFSYGNNGPIGAMLKFITEPQLEDKNYGNFSRVLESNKWTASKVTNQVKSQIEQISGELYDLVSRFLTQYREASKKYGLLALIRKNLKKFALLNFFQKHIQQYQHENGIISISEFSKKINQVIANDPIPFIYEKLGNRYNHILIDEFQDTSLLQWVNFMPLIDHTTSYYHKSLIVGDAKQSIYKFRGGEVGLIASLFEKSTTFIESKLATDSLGFERMQSIINLVEPNNLGGNYRSNMEIVELNNSIFEWIHLNTEISTKFPLLNKVYGKHVRQEPSKKVKGQSTIQFGFYTISDDLPLNKESEFEWTLKYVNNIIESSLSQNFLLKDIAILTRGNREANQLAIELKKKYPVTSSDSLLLHFAPSIKNIIAFLQLLEEPHSIIKQFEWKDTLNVLIPDENKGEQFSLKTFQELTLKESIVRYIHHFKLFSLDSEVPYLLKFLDFTDQFLQNNSNDLTSFLELYNQNKQNLSISGNESVNAITISTIHKSKGLEYPIVILPYAIWPFVSKEGNKWFDTSNEVDLDELTINQRTLNSHFLPFNSSALEHFDSLAEQKRSEEEISTLEAVNVLYVGLTRPVNNLYLLARNVTECTNKKVVNAHNNSVSSILYNYCLASDYEKDEKDHETWFTISNSNHKKDISTKTLFPEFKIQTDSFQLSEALRLRNIKHSDDSYTDTSERIEIGNYLHELVSKNSKEQLIEKLVLFRKSLDQKFIKIIDGFLMLLNDESFSYLFNLENTVLNEQEIIDSDGSIYRPDRVSKLNDTYLVIDYKTGKESQKHLEQIKNYKQKLMELGMSPVEGKIVYMTESRVENV